jgi:winged helix DNA-binding protein
MSALDAVEHLVGLQAQLPLNPYIGLWSRLERFRPDALADLLLDRRVVRVVVMRATLHLVTADDCLLLRPLMQPVLDRELARHPQFAPALDGVDLDAVLAFARQLLAERPRTGDELRVALKDRFPDHDAAALAYACRNRLAFVQVPPRVSGAEPPGSPRRQPSPGSAAPSPPTRRSTTSSSATSPRSARRPSQTCPPGRA